MKYIAKNIAAGFKNNRFLIILILVIQIVSFWIFLFSFGMFNSYIDPHSVYSFAQKEYKISFLRTDNEGKYDKSGCMTVGEFRSCLNEFKEKMGEDFCYVGLSCLSEYRNENGGIIPLRSFVMTQEEFQSFVEDGYINKKASLFESFDRMAGEWGTVSANSRYKNIIGDKYIIKGKGFDVEYISDIAFVCIAFQSLPDESLIYEMEVNLPNIPDRKKREEVRSMFSEFFGLPQDAVAEPPGVDGLLGEQEVKSNILLYFLISVLIQANLQLIFIHLILKRGKGREAFILSGCSALRFRLVVLGEILLLLAAGTAAGWFSFNGLLTGHIRKIIEDFPILYGSRLFVYGCRCYTGVALAFSIISVAANIKGGGKQKEGIK